MSAPDGELAATVQGGLTCEFSLRRCRTPTPDAVDQLVIDEVASRITAQDPTLWGPDAEAEAAIRLSWATLAHTSRPLVEEIQALRAGVAGRGGGPRRAGRHGRQLAGARR